MKSPDQAEPGWTGYCRDVLPFLISLEYILGDGHDLFVYPAVLFDTPHTIFWLY